MTDHGIIVTKKNISPFNAIDRDKNINSSDNYLKIFKSGVTSITTDGSGNGKSSISHGLGYSPAFYVWRRGNMQYTTLDASLYLSCYTPVNGQTSKWITNNDKIYSYSNEDSLIIGLSGAATSTTYFFTYYIFIDPAQQAVTQVLENTAGYKTRIRVAKPGKDALEGDEADQSFTSEYRMLKNLNQGKQGATVTVTGYTASLRDQAPTGGGYVDFVHDLGYQPFYLAFIENTSGYNYEIPQLFSNTLGSTGYAITDIIDSWCNTTKIRIGVYNKATWDSETFGDNSSAPFLTGSCKLKVYVFEENLDGQ